MLGLVCGGLWVVGCVVVGLFFCGDAFLCCCFAVLLRGCADALVR